MKTRHIIAIGILTATAVGLLALGIKLNHKPKTCETKATYNFNNVNITNTTEKYSISGTTTNTQVSRNTTPTLSQLNYTFTKNENQWSTYINVTTLYYLDELDNIEQNVVTSIISEQYFDDISKEIKTITIEQQTILISNNNTRFECIYHINLNYTDNTRTQYQMSCIGRTQYAIYCDDPSPNIIIETIDVKTTIDAFEHNYETGYTTGYQTGQSMESGNFMSLRSLILNVLTMPFTFISQAFNVTMWEGTPYAINIANFIKSLIAIASILFIIKLFTSGFSVIGNYTYNRDNRNLKRSQTKLNQAKTKEIQSGKPRVTIHHNYEHKEK